MFEVIVKTIGTSIRSVVEAPPVTETGFDREFVFCRKAACTWQNNRTLSGTNLPRPNHQSISNSKVFHQS
jgi:hypothetical protein